MKVMIAARGAMIIAVWLVLTGGYALHQYSLASGMLTEWTDFISGPNLVIGWLVLAACVVFALIPDDSGDEPK